MKHSETMVSNETFALKWNDFTASTSITFINLRSDTDFCDVTLASEDRQHIMAHKVILAASSSILRDIFLYNKHSHP